MNIFSVLIENLKCRIIEVVERQYQKWCLSHILKPFLPADLNKSRWILSHDCESKTNAARLVPVSCQPLREMEGLQRCQKRLANEKQRGVINIRAELITVKCDPMLLLRVLSLKRELIMLLSVIREVKNPVESTESLF